MWGLVDTCRTAFRPPPAGGMSPDPESLSGGGHRCLQGREVEGAVVALAVDEEGRRSGDDREVGGLHVACDASLVPAVCEVVPKSLGVEAQLLGISQEVGQAEVFLSAEQQVVHLPEGPLRGGGLGGLGSQLRLGVYVGQGQVSPHVSDVGVGEELTYDRLCSSAEGTLEVAELDHGDRRIEGPPDVIVLDV